VQSLADACGVSRRTIFRDLDALREAEVPLFYDSTHQTYAIPSQYFLAPTQFSAEEARAIVILCHELGNEEHLPFLADAREAAVKIENSLSLNLRAKLRDYANAIRIRLGCMTPLANHKTNFELLLEAIVSRRALRVRYESYTEQQNITTLLHPYRLVFNLHSWYVIGRSTLHREVRTLNLSRIHEPEMLEETFTMPQGFSLDRYFGNAWRMIPPFALAHSSPAT
jgi:predicted DNA-binding transcriptional regulator YafY